MLGAATEKARENLTRINEPPANRPLPRSDNAERALIGMILQSNGEVLNEVSASLNPDDFGYQRNRDLYLEALNCWKKLGHISHLSFTEWLNERNKLEDLGGELYLTDCRSYVKGVFIGAVAVNEAISCVNIIAEHAMRRDVIAASYRAIERAYTWQEDDALFSPAKLVAEVEEELDVIRKRISRQMVPKPAGDAMLAEFWQMAKENAEGLPFGVSSNLDALNAIMSPIRKGELCVIGGATSMGKSTLALANFAVPAAKGGIATLVCSSEMTVGAMARRLMACSYGACHLLELKDYRHRCEYWDSNDHKTRRDTGGRTLGDALTRSIAGVQEWPLYLIYDGELSPQRVRSYIKRVEYEYDQQVGLVVVDHLHRMRSDRKHNDFREKFTDVIQDLAGVAASAEVAMVVAAQLRRAPDGRVDKRPHLTDLKESGDIEQAADYVIFPYRPAYYGEEGVDDFVAEIILAKQRDGQTGNVNVKFDGQRNRFSN